MPLIKNRYGKGRVRVMRIHRDGDRHEVSQLNVKAMMEGDFAPAYTHGDNSTSVSTDTIKNVVNVIARENTGLCTEEFCQVLAGKYSTPIRRSPRRADRASRTKWSRLSFKVASRIRIVSCSTATASPPWNCHPSAAAPMTMSSGIDGFAFFTQS